VNNKVVNISCKYFFLIKLFQLNLIKISPKVVVVVDVDGRGGKVADF
jgi:hypothetical protein